MVDMNARREFGAKLLQIYTGAMLTNLINIGYRTGLFEAAAAGPSTIEELSGRAGLHQRYVREWLGAMTTGGIFDYDEASQQFALCPDRAALLTGDQAANVAPVSGMIVHTSKHVPAPRALLQAWWGRRLRCFSPRIHEVYGRRLTTDLR
jgi:Rv2258c-like winged HTH domain